MEENNKVVEVQNNETTDEQNVTPEAEHIDTPQEKKKRRIKTVLKIAALVAFVLGIIGGFSNGCIRCTNCGDDDTRFFVYASGTDVNGVAYKSCVGPAGCLGFGLGTKCWPTECTYVKQYGSEQGTLSGCVTYYNSMGCISNSDVKSEGKYTDSLTCMGISCTGKRYVETVAETTQAKQTSTCLGMSCGGKRLLIPRTTIVKCLDSLKMAVGEKSKLR